ncbi:hypothetical protein ACQUFY_10865 [Robbsia andropogonis]|uniref:hypothetical protein n=1 Tax=Robbsia andropogonis TaxID=28092 RepID=UPI003D263B73
MWLILEHIKNHMNDRPTTAIFQSTEHALHVAYTVLAQPAMSDGKFRKYLMQALECQDTLSMANVAWLEQLRGSASATVNFGGLSQLEVRGQCAMIESAVNSRLSSRERGAVIARYGAWHQKRHGFDLMVSTCGAPQDMEPCASALFDPDGVVFALATRHYMTAAERKRLAEKGIELDLTFRGLAEHYGQSKSSLQRTADWIKATFDGLEKRAVSVLDPVFKAHGVVQSY